MVFVRRLDEKTAGKLNVGNNGKTIVFTSGSNLIVLYVMTIDLGSSISVWGSIFANIEFGYSVHSGSHSLRY